MSKNLQKRLFPKVAFDISVTPLVSSSDVGRAIKFGQSVTFYWTFYWRELRNDANIIRCSHLAPWISCHSWNYFSLRKEKWKMVHYSQFLFDPQAFSTIDKIEKVLVQTCLKHLNYGVPWPIPDCLLPRKCQLPWKRPCIGKRLVVKKRPGERKHFPFPNRKEKTFPFQTEKKTLSLSKLKSCFLSKTLNELQCSLKWTLTR